MVILPSKENLSTIDWTDSKQLFAFSVETVRIAGKYQAARKEFATTVAVLKTHLASAYKDGTIETKHSEEKAYIMLSHKDELVRTSIITRVQAENNYKGLEKVVEARQATISLAQSLIKNRIENE